MADEYRTAGALLDGMTALGVYDVTMLDEQFSKYGFTYNRATDKLHFRNGAERLGVGDRSQVERAIERDPKGGVMFASAEGARMFQAVDLSRAIHRLLMPGQPVPGDEYMDRAKSFRANVHSILAYEANTDPLEREH